MLKLFSSRFSNGGKERQGGREEEQSVGGDGIRNGVVSCFSCLGKKYNPSTSMESNMWSRDNLVVQNALGIALDELEWIILRENAHTRGLYGRSGVQYVKFVLGLAKALHLCKNKLAELDVRGEPVLRMLEGIVLKRYPGIHSFYHRVRHFEGDYKQWIDMMQGLESGFLGSTGGEIRKAMEVPFQILSDVFLQQSAAASSDFEMGDLLNIIDSLLHIVHLLPKERFSSTLHPPGVIPPTIRFLKNFILFASSFQGVLLARGQTTEDLFIHVECSLVHFMCSISGYEFSVKVGFHESMRRIEPLEPHVCGIYVGFLQELALQLSRSPIIPATPAGSHDHAPLVLLDFVDSLLFLLLKLLLFHGSSHQYFFRRRIRELYEGLEFLKATLSEHHDNKVGHQQYEKMHEHIRPVICAAGIVISSLFMETEDEEGLVENLEFLFSAFEEKFKLVKGVEEETRIYSLPSASCFPQTNLQAFIVSLLEKMESVNASDADSTAASRKDEFQTIHIDLSFLRSFLVDVTQESNQNEKLRALLGRVAVIAYETEFVLDTMLSGRDMQSVVKMLQTIIEEIRCIKVEASDECSGIKEKVFQVQDVTKNYSKIPSIGKLTEVNDHVVGLDDEIQNIVDQLTRGTGKLDIISIVGMAGLGKTTLAKKVCCHLSIVHRFQVRSWCTISQVYHKKSLLLEILRDIDSQSADKCLEMNENDLAQKIYQSLKGKRYLIILDDVWDDTAWSELHNIFPDDTKGSRILMTSRYEYVASQIKPQTEPHRLRFLTDDESWELFQMKVGFPSEIHDRGKAIAKRCKGLPLMIVVIAGLLSNMEPSSWEDVEESLIKGKDECIDAISLSYSHLPPHLKLCFLYFGAYAEDQKIRVREMIWLWVAEGFVQDNGRDCIEDVAEGYMVELIKRNLVMIAGKECVNRVRFCMLHDLIHEFCCKTANKEQFLHRLHGREISTTSIEPCMLHRLRVFSNTPEDFEESRLHCTRLRTLFFLSDHQGWHPFLPPRYGILYNFCQSNFLGVLDLRGLFGFTSFPLVILVLVRLRFLALLTGLEEEIPSREWEIPSSIEHLSNLETFIVQGLVNVILPNTVWNMKNIRHLYLSSENGDQWVLSIENVPKCLSFLENLQSFCRVGFSCYQTMKEVMRKCPNIRKLKCVLKLKREDTKCADEDFKIIELDCLSQLEALCLRAYQVNPIHFLFPGNLKKLTLLGVGLPWSKISTLDRLPNLEVLNLVKGAFVGKHWEMQEEEDTGAFPRLRFLKLEKLDLARWTGPDDIFPCLEKLVLQFCDNLVELPSFSFVTSSTLEVIKVICCNRSDDLLKEIQDMQMDMGNEDLKILNLKINDLPGPILNKRSGWSIPHDRELNLRREYSVI